MKSATGSGIVLNKVTKIRITQSCHRDLQNMSLNLLQVKEQIL